MNDLLENSYQLSLIVGTIFSITSIITQVFPPKKINLLYGYRTKASMKNQAAWDFAQKYSAKKMGQIGIFLIVFSSSKFIFGDKYEILFNFLPLFLAVVLLFFLTEKAIKDKF